MAKKFKDQSVHEPIHHKTSLGRRPSLQKMNKSKRRTFKRYAGQGDKHEVYLNYDNLFTNLWHMFAIF